MLVPVYEVGKVGIDELLSLVCWSSHEVKPFDSFYKENDILYEIFFEGPGLYVYLAPLLYDRCTQKILLEICQ